jgi:PAS domain S-box-containing protein
MNLTPEESIEIIRNSPTLIWKSGKDRAILFFSDSWLAFTGRTKEEEIENGWQNGIHPDDLEECLRVYEYHFNERRPFVVEYRLKRHDGVYRHMLDSGKPLFDSSGNFKGYIGYVYDVTEQKAGTAELAKREAQYREIVDNTSDVIYTLNSTGDFLFVSQAWERQLGHELHEVVGESFTKFVHPDDLELCFAALNEAYQTGKRLNDVEYRIQHKDGSWRWHSSSGMPKTTQDGQSLFNGIAHDITRQKADEARIAKQSAMHRLFIDLAGSFINLPLEEVDSTINRALASVGNFFEVDRVYIFEYNWEKGICINTYEWCADGVTPEIANLQEVPLSALKLWVETHKKGEKMVVDTRDYSGQEELREILEPQGIKTLITLPFMIERKATGFVGFDSVNTYRNYTQSEEDLLVVFAEMLSNIWIRKQSQSQLLASKNVAERKAKELREAQQIAGLASWYMDVKTGEVTWSEELYRMYGFDPSLPPPAYGEQEKIFSPESWKQLTGAVAKTAENGIPYQLELNFVRPDDTNGWMWARGEAEFDATGTITGLRGVAQDITDRKLLELELKESTEQYETVANRLQIASSSAGFGFWEWDVSQNELIWDRRMFELYGYPPSGERVTFEAWSERINPEDIEAARKDVSDALEGSKEFNSTFRVAHPNGKEYFILGYAHVLRNADGTANKMIGVNLDITESKLHQRNLEMKNKQLVDFSNVVAHNLRAPLVNIELLTDLIRESEELEEVQELSGQLKEVLAHLNEVFGELMESIQIRQETEVKTSTVNLEERIQKTLTGFRSQLKQCNGTVHVHVEETPAICYPPKYIQSILSNLISNAVKYRSPERPLIIDIETKRINRDVILAVKDNGLGIDMNLAKDKLFKIRKVFHKHPDARGFGLFLVKTQVEAMDGEVWAESTPDEGSTFFVKFKNALA